MSKQSRLKAAARIQKAHDDYAIHRGEADFMAAHINREELLALLADAERENDKLQKSSDLFEITTNNLQIALLEQERENDLLWEHAEHRSFCASWTQNGFGECDCKLDELLNKGVSDESKN